MTSESAPGEFIFTQNEAQAPTVQMNLDAARTNAFYVVNTVHDISYVYGFTEAGFNFQNNNFGKGGAGNDRVTISVQDANGINNGASLCRSACRVCGLVLKRLSRQSRLRHPRRVSGVVMIPICGAELTVRDAAASQDACGCSCGTS